MNEFMRISSEYFDRFEGMRFYPTWKTYHWYLVLITGLLFLGAAGLEFSGETTSPKMHWPVLALLMTFEVAFFIACAMVYEHKSANVLAGAPKDRVARREYMDARRIAALEELTKVSRTEFLRLAKECEDLKRLRLAFRQSSTVGREDFREWTLPRDARPRVVGMLLTTVAVVAALLTRSLPQDFDFVSLIVEDGSKIGWLVVMAGAIFMMGIGLRMLLRAAFEGLSMGWTKLRGKHASEAALNYFVRDLLRYHAISVSATEPVIASRLHDASSSNQNLFDAPDVKQGSPLPRKNG
jgi:hypothetical protein